MNSIKDTLRKEIKKIYKMKINEVKDKREKYIYKVYISNKRKVPWTADKKEGN